jgi:hypothetical protein
MAWTTYESDGLSIRVDSGIVPPWRWRLSALQKEPGIAARWDGLDPFVVDRKSLDDAREPESRSRARRSAELLVAPVIASAVAVLWALHVVHPGIEWLSAGHLLLAAAFALVAFPAWLHEKRKRLAERRAHREIDAEMAQGTVPLRTLGQDQARGGELG